MATSKKALTADAILSANDARIESVTVPEWGGVVHIKAWSAADREAFERSIIGPDGEMIREGFRAKVVARSLCGPDGALLFTSPEQLAAFMGKNAAIIEKLFAISDRLNAVSDAAIAEMEGN